MRYIAYLFTADVKLDGLNWLDMVYLYCFDTGKVFEFGGFE